jgi:hypothetical protein
MNTNMRFALFVNLVEYLVHINLIRLKRQHRQLPCAFLEPKFTHSLYSRIWLQFQYKWNYMSYIGLTIALYCIFVGPTFIHYILFLSHALFRSIWKVTVPIQIYTWQPNAASIYICYIVWTYFLHKSLLIVGASSGTSMWFVSWTSLSYLLDGRPLLTMWHHNFDT